MKLAQEYGKLYLAEDPFTETAPTVPSKPNKNDYSLGEDDPAYIEAYNTYMAGSKAKAEYDCRKNMHTAACNIKGVQKAEGAASEFAGLADFMNAAVAAVQKNSKIRGKAYSLGVDPDKSDAFLVMFRWLYGELTSAQNSQAIQTAIDSSTLGTVPKSLIKSAWNSISKLPADTAIAVLINLTAPALPSFDNVPGSNLPNTDSSNGSNAEAEKNSNSAKPDNPSIPKTGGGVAVSLFALAATAGLAGGAVLLKKKIENSKD